MKSNHAARKGKGRACAALLAFVLCMVCAPSAFAQYAEYGPRTDDGWTYDDENRQEVPPSDKTYDGNFDSDESIRDANGAALIAKSIGVESSFSREGTTAVDGEPFLPANTTQSDVKNLNATGNGLIVAGDKAYYSTDGSLLEGSSVNPTSGSETSDDGFTWNGAICMLTPDDLCRTYTNAQDSGIMIDAPGKDVMPALRGSNALSSLPLRQTTYTVTLHLNGGTIAAGKDVTSYVAGHGATLPTADDVTREFYEFKGWYDNEKCDGSPVTTIGANETGNKEYWAKWSPIPGDPPTFIEPSEPQEITAQPGGSVTLTTVTTDASVWQWYVNKNDGAHYVKVKGATEATYTISDVTLDNDGYTYYCEATNPYGSTNSPVFTLRVLPPPVFTKPSGPQEITAQPGEPVTLTTDATGASSWQWYVNKNDGEDYVKVDGATEATYTISAVALDNDGYTYYCEATNQSGTAKSPVFTLRVPQPPPIFTKPSGPQEITAQPGEPVTLTTDATGASSWQWYVNKNDGADYVTVDGATEATYTISAVALDNDGYTYYCAATNQSGTAKSPVFTLRVPQPAVTPQAAATPQPVVSPQTGDGSCVGLWALLMLMSLCGLLLTLGRRRRSGKR